MGFVRVQNTVKRVIGNEAIHTELVIKVYSKSNDLVMTIDGYDRTFSLPLEPINRIPLKIILKRHVKDEHHNRIYNMVLKELDNFINIDKLNNWEGRKTIDYDQHHCHGFLNICYRKNKPETEEGLKRILGE